MKVDWIASIGLKLLAALCCIAAVAMAYNLAVLWSAKVTLGVVPRDVAIILALLVLGGGFPYCMARYLDRR